MDSTVPSQSKLNVYDALTVKIMHAMKDAKGTYKMPWHSPVAANDMPTNAVTKHVYRGVNVLSLWVDAMAKGFRTGFWATYKQWQSLGVQVRHKERGTLIVFYRQFELSEEEKEAGTRVRSMARASWVFNAAQVENWTPPEPAHRSTVEIDQKVETFVQAVGAHIDHGYPMAQYHVDLDRIEMPSPAWFVGTETQPASEAYHATLLHELTHNAVIRIMPHGLRWRLVFPALAMRLFGIIRALPKTRGVDRRAGSDLTVLAQRQRERVPSPSSAYRRGCRSGWSRHFRDQARARSPLDRRRGEAGPSQYCGEAYAA